MKRRILGAGLLALACLLTACGVRSERAADAQETPVVETESETADGGADTPQACEPAGDLLPDLDISAVSAAMSEEERAAFETYLPVLQGEETFRWAAGPYDGYPGYDWESLDAWLAENMPGDVAWYAPDGGTFPEGM